MPSHSYQTSVQGGILGHPRKGLVAINGTKNILGHCRWRSEVRGVREGYYRRRCREVLPIWSLIASSMEGGAAGFP